jgi:predicted cupin superfamily sugar epimerase
MPAMTELPAWARGLHLRPHPEGGWYAETYRHATRVGKQALGPAYPSQRSLATAILFLLLPGERSEWHRVLSDELWFHHRGGPLRLTLGGAAAAPSLSAEVVLGSDLEAGQRPQALVPGGYWQTASPVGGEAVLVSCVVTPGFEFEDFTLAD